MRTEKEWEEIRRNIEQNKLSLIRESLKKNRLDDKARNNVAQTEAERRKVLSEIIAPVTLELQ